MGFREPAEDGITRRLQEAIDRLQEDLRRVEIWAGALSGFLQPVPGYDVASREHMLPRRDERPRMPSGKPLHTSNSAISKRG